MDDVLLAVGGAAAGLLIVATSLAWAFRPRRRPSRLAPPSGRQPVDSITGAGDGL